MFRHTFRARVGGAMTPALLDLLAPPSCAACRTPLDAGPLCAGCRATLPWLHDPCPRCALPRRGGRCRACPAAQAAFTHAYAPLAHAGPARDLVLALKLRGLVAAADLMAAQIVAGAPPGVFAEGTLLVPIPSARGRRRRRGFDPAEAIASALARRTGTRTARLLHRGAAQQQVGRGRRERLAAAARTPLEAVARAPARGAPPVVLVDDVHTTGATLGSGASALRSAGFPQISAVSYVRSLTRT